MSVWSIALTFFLVANPIGNVPAFISLLKDFPFERQKRILFREAIIAFFLAFVFILVGQDFLQIIQIQQYAVSISGGTLLFLVSLNMIFPKHLLSNKQEKPQEPFIVPIAVPLITGGGVISTIMIYTAKEPNTLKITLAAGIAWVFVTAIVVASAYLFRILGKSGLAAMEQLMGMMLSMISMEIIVKGIKLFSTSL